MELPYGVEGAATEELLNSPAVELDPAPPDELDPKADDAVPKLVVAGSQPNAVDSIGCGDDKPDINAGADVVGDIDTPARAGAGVNDSKSNAGDEEARLAGMVLLATCIVGFCPRVTLNVASVVAMPKSNVEADLPGNNSTSGALHMPLVETSTVLAVVVPNGNPPDLLVSHEVVFKPDGNAIGTPSEYGKT